MNKFNVIVGIDVAKATLAVCLHYAGLSESFTIDNDIKGLSGLVNKLRAMEGDAGKVLICCENTGHYSEKLAMVATGEGFFVWVVAPLVISSYMVGLNRAKTDPGDAMKIKDYAFAHQHKAEQYRIPDPRTRELMGLFKSRKHFVDNRQREQNHLHSLLDEPEPQAFCVKLVKEAIASLTAKIKEVEKAIMGLVSKNAAFKRQYTLLMTIPGIGPVNAGRFLFITECFTKFPNWKNLACYIGSAPFPKESGTSVKKKPRTSKKRHRSFKSDLVEGIVSAATRKGQFYYDYYKYMESMKTPHRKIINNLINNVLKIAYAIINANTPFNPNYYLQNKKSWIKNLAMS